MIATRSLIRAGFRAVVGVALATLIGACGGAPDVRPERGKLVGRNSPDAGPSVDFIGNVFPNGVGPKAPQAEFWTQLTPENAGKWGSVESARDRMNWSVLDAAYAYAAERDIPFRYHTLVWAQQQPPWLTDLSRDEQRAEIIEWFALVAERYPDIHFVDVVNEPIHETPLYADALGGAGATGYDWVIGAFELARAYFPRAELHVNDYRILTPRSDIDEYLKVVDILMQRDLIDGIGLQAHSLERADPEVVRRRLDRVAKTGLPIYITELDVSIANDVRQAEQFSALMRVFAEHPAVRGITLWGSVENRMWREHGYLIRDDGSYRPAMDWLEAYREGRPYEIPAFVAEPRVGTSTRLVLEAEDYDVGEGIESAGNVIAYVDDGDYIGFESVAFRMEYTAVRIRYAKASATRAGVDIRLNSLNSEPLVSLRLDPTGGWNTFRLAETELPAVSGTHDVYVTFRLSDTNGVGNFDWFLFYAE